jgi:hypothetical protein
MKRLIQNDKHPAGKDALWGEALAACLGEDAVDLERLSRRKRQTLGGEATPMGLGDFFFDPEDPLHPDAEEEDDNE